jgi:hypothetical protein
MQPVVSLEERRASVVAGFLVGESLRSLQKTAQFSAENIYVILQQHFCALTTKFARWPAQEPRWGWTCLACGHEWVCGDPSAAIDDVAAAVRQKDDELALIANKLEISMGRTGSLRLSSASRQ